MLTLELKATFQSQGKKSLKSLTYTSIYNTWQQVLRTSSKSVQVQS